MVLRFFAPAPFVEGQEVDITYSAGTMVFLIGTFRIVRAEGNSMLLETVTIINTPPSVGMKVGVAAYPGTGGEKVGDLFSGDYGQVKPVNIKAIQDLLRELGYDPGDVVGIMTDRTEAAIRQFQEDNLLPVDGKATHDLHSILHATVNSFESCQKKTRQDAQPGTGAQSSDSGPSESQPPRSQPENHEVYNEFGDAFDDF
jgi:hypothetical protein